MNSHQRLPKDGGDDIPPDEGAGMIPSSSDADSDDDVPEADEFGDDDIAEIERQIGAALDEEEEEAADDEGK